MRTARLTREQQLPKGAIKVADKRSDAVAFIYADSLQRPCALGFSGKRDKPDIRYYFRDEASREKVIRRYLESVQAANKAKQERAEARKALGNPFVVGDILVSSWGYDQTNCDWYQVTYVSGSRVKIRPLAQNKTATGWETGTCIPVRDKFTGEETTHRANGDRIALTSYSSARKWDGQPERWSSYA